MRRQWLHYLLPTTLSVLLFACAVDPFAPQEGSTPVNKMQAILETGVEIDKAQGNQGVPEEVTEALFPDFKQTASNNIKVSDQRFDISVNSVDAKTFFLGLVQGTSYNMVLAPDLKGSVTLDLKNVTIEEAMRAARDTYGFDYEVTPYGYQVSSNSMKSRIFNINYLDMERSSTSQILINSGQVSQTSGGGVESNNYTGVSTQENPYNQTIPAAKIETKSKSDFWGSLATSLQALIANKPGRQIIINPEAGVIIAYGQTQELDQIGEYLDWLQNIMVRQVLLEAKILEVRLNDSYQAGIDWQILGAVQDGTQSLEIPDSITSSETLKDFTQIFTLKATGGSQFSTVIELLTTQGNVQVLSSPRIATLNHQKAVIKVGYDEFFVTDVSSTNTAVTGTAQNTQDVELTPFFSGVALDVTPQINPDGNVILHIHPIISRVVDKQKKVILNDLLQDIPTALSIIRESDSLVQAKNGQVVVIGGLMQDYSDEELGETPFISKVPFFGSMFRKTEQLVQKTELIILLKPTIVDKAHLVTDMNNSIERFKELNRGGHFGDLYENIGNMAEFPEAERTYAPHR